MSHVPAVGIAIANYNKARFLPDCLRSIQTQDYPNIKLVVVDDGSTDDSMAILETYQSRLPEMIIIRNARNLGVARSRNIAINQLSAEWISTLDSDDFLFRKDKISREMATIMASESPMSAAYSGITRVDSAGRRISRLRPGPPLGEGRLFESLLSRACLIPRDFTFPKQLFEEVGGFDPGLPIYEDWDFKLRLAKRVSFLYSGITGVAYRQTGTGLSAVHDSEHLEWLRTIFDRHVSSVADPDLVRAEFEKNIRPGLAVRILGAVSRMVPKPGR